MPLVQGSQRMVITDNTDPVAGQVRWAPGKSIWMTGMTVAAVVLGPLSFTWDAFALFLTTSAVTLCFGHSVGMHRRLIHNSFECPLWLEYLCVYLGVLVGMAGPIGMIRQHDLRDWAQRQRACHDYLRHRQSFWRDGFWQLHCELKLRHPPALRLEPRLAGDPIYAWLERHWMAQQLPWGMLFYGLGGPSWLVWGVCVRVAVCVTGHWLVGHYAHRQGSQSWIVQDAAAQGYNVKIAGLISMGESWHNNHHAFPDSARIGLLPGQIDFGWLLILVFRRAGLAWNIKTPDDLPHRAELRRVQNANPGCCVCRMLVRRRGHVA